MPENIAGTTGFTAGAYQKPSSKDSGSTVFTTLEEFMTRIAAHTHDGANSELINRTVTKTEYTTQVLTGPSSFSGPDSLTGLYYVDVSITVGTHHVNAGGAGQTANTASYSFWYYADVIVAGNGPGWVEFYPDVSWNSFQQMSLHTSIVDTILAASGNAKIKVMAY
jgi:hypothetical protein